MYILLLLTCIYQFTQYIVSFKAAFSHKNRSKNIEIFTYIYINTHRSQICMRYLWPIFIDRCCVWLRQISGIQSLFLESSPTNCTMWWDIVLICVWAISPLEVRFILYWSGTTKTGQPPNPDGPKNA
jgi:hypothetical protein